MHQRGKSISPQNLETFYQFITRREKKKRKYFKNFFVYFFDIEDFFPNKARGILTKKSSTVIVSHPVHLKMHFQGASCQMTFDLSHTIHERYCWMKEMHHQRVLLGWDKALLLKFTNYHEDFILIMVNKLFLSHLYLLNTLYYSH